MLFVMTGELRRCLKQKTMNHIDLNPQQLDEGIPEVEEGLREGSCHVSRGLTSGCSSGSAGAAMKCYVISEKTNVFVSSNLLNFSPLVVYALQFLPVIRW